LTSPGETPRARADRLAREQREAKALRENLLRRKARPRLPASDPAPSPKREQEPEPADRTRGPA